VLFPIVGQLKEDTYLFNGKRYPLPRHGFARDRTFEIIEQGEDQVKLRLSADEQTMQAFPFLFHLIISYQLTENSLEVGYEVQNPGKEPLPFSIGGHPAFHCPLVPGTTFKDHYLLFEKEEAAATFRLTDGLLNGQQTPILQHTRELPLTYQLFDHDALIFKHLKSNWVELRSHKHHHAVRLDFKDFPFLGIWTQPKAPFICLEPWLGLADRADASGYLLDKEGIQVVMPHDSFVSAYQLTFT
jgi:galactose mutarotase-like enzyme